MEKNYTSQLSNIPQCSFFRQIEEEGLNNDDTVDVCQNYNFLNTASTMTSLSILLVVFLKKLNQKLKLNKH